MKKIVILALHLGYGGVENAISTLANTLSSKYEVEILSTYRMYNEPVYELNPNIKVSYISNIKPNKKQMMYYLKRKNFKMFFKEIPGAIRTGWVKYVKTAFRVSKLNCDVIVSTRTTHNFIVSLFGKKHIKKIAWEHNHHNNNSKYIKSLVKSCKNVNNLVLVSKELEDYYKNYLGDKAVYIPHALDNITNKVSKLDSENLIAVGRLSKEKGFDDLLRVFKRVSLKYSDLKLNIVGDGMEKDNLLNLAKDLKLGDKVIFHGFQNKEYINNLFLDSSLYLMTSHTESFGLVLIEAMNYGIPCISYTSAQGANEIITDGEDGFLIKDRSEDDMFEKITLLIDDSKLRKQMGKKAKEKSKNYSSDVVLEKWSKLINKRK